MSSYKTKENCNCGGPYFNSEGGLCIHYKSCPAFVPASNCICEEDNKLTQALCPIHGAPAFKTVPALEVEEKSCEHGNMKGCLECYKPEHTTWEPSSINAAVFEALGEASVSWAEMPRGVFNSEKVTEIGTRLCSFIERALAHAKEEGYNEGYDEGAKMGVEHCGEKDCPECNLAAYNAGKEEGREIGFRQGIKEGRGIKDVITKLKIRAYDAGFLAAQKETVADIERAIAIRPENEMWSKSQLLAFVRRSLAPTPEQPPKEI